MPLLVDLKQYEALSERYAAAAEPHLDAGEALKLSKGSPVPANISAFHGLSKYV
jgi:hypothetical protein